MLSSLKNWRLSFGEHSHNLLAIYFCCRFFEQDEEMLLLTQSDEISRTYEKDQGPPVHVHSTQNVTSCGDARTTCLSPPEQLNPTVREGTTSNLIIGASWQDSQTFKETKATVISSGPSTITITSALSPADCSKSYWLERRCAESEGNGAENSQFSQEQLRKNKRKRTKCLAGALQDNMQNKGSSECEGGGEEDEKEGSSQFCTSLEEERTGTTLANPAQGPSEKPPNTISAWEAGWNVTNAIQVRHLLHPLLRKKEDVDKRIINPVPHILVGKDQPFDSIIHEMIFFFESGCFIVWFWRMNFHPLFDRWDPLKVSAL